jgi:hypothetical protein
MPGLNDFLNNGNVPLAPTASTTQSQMPAWYTNYAMQLLSDQQGYGAQPFQTFQGPRVAGFTPDNERAFELTRQVARPEGLQKVEGALGDISQRSAFGAASPYFGNAAGMSGVAAATPLASAGANYFNASVSPTGISLATPFLDRAGQTSASQVGQYMSPYQGGVLDRIGDLGARNLREKFLPELTDRFIASGQMGGISGEAPSRFGVELGRGIRDAQESVLAEQARYLDKGYGDAMGAASADLSRFGTLGGVAGGLGSDQQRIMQSAGSGVGTLASLYGNLTGSDADRQLAIGTQAGSMYDRDTQNQMQVQRMLAEVANQRQTMGLRGADALNNVGALQQGLTQRNYDTAYGDFREERDYPGAMIDRGVGVLQGVAGAVPKGQTQFGYGPADSDSITQNPSTLQKISTAVATALGLKSLG